MNELVSEMIVIGFNEPFYYFKCVLLKQKRVSSKQMNVLQWNA
jgi:hypothetical protein